MDRTLKFWDVATGEQLLALETFDHPIQEMRFSPDGKILAAIFPTGTSGPPHAKAFLWRTAEVVAEPAATEKGQSKNPAP